MGAQRIEVNWFGKGGIGCRQQRLGLVVLGSRQHHDRSAQQQAPQLARRAECSPMHHRHHDIEQNQLRAGRGMLTVGARLRPGANAAGRIAKRLQEHRHQLANAGIIITNQNRFGGHRFLAYACASRPDGVFVAANVVVRSAGNGLRSLRQRSRLSASSPSGASEVACG